MNYYKINPGGNITAIVQGAFSAEEKIEISKKIMEKDLTVEQVGFWTYPKNKNNDGRLEMAGGEFCGNALRALGMLLFKKNGKTKLYLESSGRGGAIETTIKGKNSGITLPLSDLSGSNNSCFLPGIAYFITDKKIIKSDVKEILNKKFKNFPASGVISYKKNNDSFSIKPIVWVKGVDTLVEETACGSGTMALAYFFYQTDKTTRFRIKQPSGSIFSVFLKDENIYLSGPVLKIEEIFFNRIHAHSNMQHFTLVKCGIGRMM